MNCMLKDDLLRDSVISDLLATVAKDKAVAKPKVVATDTDNLMRMDGSFESG